jgi:hypothetical protein
VYLYWNTRNVLSGDSVRITTGIGLRKSKMPPTDFLIDAPQTLTSDTQKVEISAWHNPWQSAETFSVTLSLPPGVVFANGTLDTLQTPTGFGLQSVAWKLQIDAPASTASLPFTLTHRSPTSGIALRTTRFSIRISDLQRQHWLPLAFNTNTQ